jgi:hypothetical protein
MSAKSSKGNGYTAEGGFTRENCTRTDGPTGRKLSRSIWFPPEDDRPVRPADMARSPGELRKLANGFGWTDFTPSQCGRTDGGK